MTPLTPGATRHIPASDGYPGLFAIAITETKEIVAMGKDAESAVRRRADAVGERER